MQSHAAGVTKYQNILWTEWTNEHTLDDYVKGVKKKEGEIARLSVKYAS